LDPLCKPKTNIYFSIKSEAFAYGSRQICEPLTDCVEKRLFSTGSGEQRCDIVHLILKLDYFKAWIGRKIDI
jgi:hypothetical protein